MAELNPEGVNGFVQAANATPPSIGGSMFNSFIENEYGVIASATEKRLLKPGPTLNDFVNVYNQIQFQNQKEQELTTPGQMAVRKGLSLIPAMIGMGLDPISLPFGVGAGKVAEMAIGALAPRMAAKQAARKALVAELGSKAAVESIPRTAGEIVAAGTHGAGGMLGYSLPSSFVNAWDADTRTLDNKEFAKEMFFNGTMGVGFGVAGYGFGVLWSRVFGREGAIPVSGRPETPDALARIRQKYEGGEIGKPEFEMLHGFLTDPKDPKITEQFKKFLKENGNKVDTFDNKALFTMLTAEDLDNLKGTFANELNNSEIMSDKAALSQFTLHDRLDEMRSNPDEINGLKGSIALMNERLSHREERTRTLDEQLDKSLHEGLEERMPLDQQHIYDTIKQKEGEQHPFTVPGHVEKLMRAGENEYVQLLTPKEELTYIRERLLGKNAEVYRGTSENTFGYKSLEEAGTSEEALMRPDFEFGKGYWYADTLEHAKSYGKRIEKSKGRFRVFDVDKNHNPELTRMYREIHNIEPMKLLGTKEGLEKVEAFRNAVKNAGYEGIRRFGVVGKDSGRYETMFFEKPKFTSNTPLRKNFQNTRAYKRLVELSEVWHNAKSLLDRIHLEHTYERQEAFRDVAQAFVDALNANIDRFANQDRVNNYLKERIDQLTRFDGESSYSGKELTEKDTKKILDREKNLPADADESLNELTEEVNQEKAAENIKDNFNFAAERYNQFKDNEDPLADMVNCYKGL